MNNESTISGLALDIDDTLSWTCREWADILLQEFGNPENLTNHEFEQKYRLVEKAPYFQNDQVLARCLELCYDEHNYHEIPPIDGALSALQEIQRIIPITAYLTARPEPLRKVTNEWISKHGFPNAELIMNPQFSVEKKGNWKRDELVKRYPRIVGIIDDNPSVCHDLSHDYPGTIFLYRHHEVHPHPRVVSCTDWDDVAKKVTEHYATRANV